MCMAISGMARAPAAECVCACILASHVDPTQTSSPHHAGFSLRLGRVYLGPKMQIDATHAAKRQFYKTARIVGTDHYVKLDRFCQASQKYDYADFWQVTCDKGKPFNVFERELTDFCL